MRREDRLFKSNSDLIKALMRLSKQCGYKKSWVTFEFARQSYKPILDDFKLLEEQMGYKSGWANIKFKEYYDNLV